MKLTIPECNKLNQLIEFWQQAKKHQPDKDLTIFALEMQSRIKQEIKSMTTRYAKDVPIGTSVSYFQKIGMRVGNQKGKVICNQMIDGNEVVAVEWSNGDIQKMNVNDLSL